MNRIIKIAENNVEVQTYYHDNGEEVIVHRETYGQERIYIEEGSATTSKAEWTDKDMEAYQTEQIAKYQNRLDLLTSIQEAMDE